MAATWIRLHFIIADKPEEGKNSASPFSLTILASLVLSSSFRLLQHLRSKLTWTQNYQHESSRQGKQGGGVLSCCMIHLSLGHMLFKTPTAVFISAHYQKLQSPSPQLTSHLLYCTNQVFSKTAGGEFTPYLRMGPLTGRLYHILPFFPFNWITFSKH